MRLLGARIDRSSLHVHVHTCAHAGLRTDVIILPYFFVLFLRKDLIVRAFLVSIVWSRNDCIPGEVGPFLGTR